MQDQHHLFKHFGRRIIVLLAVALAVALGQSWHLSSRVPEPKFDATQAALQERLRQQVEIVDALRAVERSPVPIGDEMPAHMPSSREKWKQLVRLRIQRQTERESRRMAPDKSLTSRPPKEQNTTRINER